MVLLKNDPKNVNLLLSLWESSKINTRCCYPHDVPNADDRVKKKFYGAKQTASLWHCKLLYINCLLLQGHCDPKGTLSFFIIKPHFFNPRTSGAEWPIVGRCTAVTQVSIVLLHTLSSIPAVHSKTGAVALAARLDPRCDLGPLFEIKCNSVHPQGSDTSQETSLSSCSTYGVVQVR